MINKQDLVRLSKKIFYAQIETKHCLARVIKTSESGLSLVSRVQFTWLGSFQFH